MPLLNERIHKGWAIPALALRYLMIYCASPLWLTLYQSYASNEMYDFA
jgi:hypothetical protein